jgi:hypothetical protein
LPNSRTPKLLAPCWPLLRSNGESSRKRQRNVKSTIGHLRRKRYVRTSAREPRFDSARQRQRRATAGLSKRTQQTLQSAGGAVDALAGVNVLNLDNPAASSAHSVDGMHAEPAITDKPGHHQLGHCPPLHFVRGSILTEAHPHPSLPHRSQRPPRQVRVPHRRPLGRTGQTRRHRADHAARRRSRGQLLVGATA